MSRTELRAFSGVSPPLDNPDYETISYCLGDPNNQASILCNKSWLPVPKNLEEALRAIRYIDK